MKGRNAKTKEQRIMEAAEQVFSRKGYREATLDEIIRIADTGKGTVYKYYKNKATLFYTLVKEKNAPFVKELQSIEKADLLFTEKLKNYYLTVLRFVERNYVIWQVLLFEITAGTNGWRLVRHENDDGYDVDVRWGDMPSEEQINFIKKYYEIFLSELVVLEDIIAEGVKNKTIKPSNDLRAMTANIYFGLIMMAFQHTDKKVKLEDLVDMLVDRFMNGYKI
ncbi:MAG: TetR/AcrR family transcriptional regulator [Acidaminococcaceae bacterium]|nr:TetR/AcrR family transcriptional regulator [Acidaminococcaceae bacterium]